MKSLDQIEREILALEGQGSPVSTSENVLVQLPTEPIKPQNIGKIGLVGSGPDALPDFIITGLRLLGSKKCPNISNKAVWPPIVQAAKRMADNGTAAHAIELGWSPYDLFGVWLDAVVSNDWESLAVWVRDRSPVILDSKMAAVRTATGRGWYHRRALPDGVKFLWELR